MSNYKLINALFLSFVQIHQCKSHYVGWKGITLPFCNKEPSQTSAHVLLPSKIRFMSYIK